MQFLSFFATINLHLKTEISWKNEALPVDECINCLNKKFCFIEKARYLFKTDCVQLNIKTPKILCGVLNLFTR